MSYIQSTIQCQTCHKTYNVAFGIVGTTVIASWPTACPNCGGKELIKVSNGWNATKEEE